MDYDTNDIRLGLDYSRLNEAQHAALRACLHQYVPFSLWNDDMVQSWYVNRKITAVLEADDETRFYGAIPQVNKWRHLMTLKKVEADYAQEWVVGPLWQPLPVTDAPTFNSTDLRRLADGIKRR